MLIMVSGTPILTNSRNVRDIGVSTPTSYGWALRVNLKNLKNQKLRGIRFFPS
jgi:hypothetical protein